MGIPKKKLFTDYNKYITDPDYTTAAEAQDYFNNIDQLVGVMLEEGFWQPETNYKRGAVVKSNAMQGNIEAVCMSESGKSGNVEPEWGVVSGYNIPDGTCFWQLRQKGTVVSVNGAAPNANGEVSVPIMQGADNTSAGISGLVPTPAAGNANRYLNADGTWKEISPMQGATTTSPGTSGLVPTPTAGSSIRYLCSDGTWKEVDLDSAKTKMVVYS